MARTSIALAAPLDHAWTRLQDLTTWEGVAGIEDLHRPEHDPLGNLRAFHFAMDTALGRVAGRAAALPDKPAMRIQAEQKGLEITLQVILQVAASTTQAMVQASARSTSFLSKPLALTLNALLDSSIDDEARKIASRVALG